MSTELSTPRGIVVSIWGKAYVRGINGQWRALKVGEVVRPQDALLTDQDSIVMMTDSWGQLLPVGRLPLSETDRVIADLEGNDTRAATAAGLGGGDGALELGLRVERVSESVTPATLATALAATPIDFGRATQSNPPELSNPNGVAAFSSSVSAFEEGTGVALGLTAPRGGGSLQATVTQVPLIGQIVTAAGAPVVAGSTLTPSELTGLRYLPPADYSGQPIAPFTYTVSNGSFTASGSTQISVTAVNDAPLATAGAASGNEDTPIAVNLGGTDVDGTIAGVRVTTLPANGALLLADGVTAVTAGQLLTAAQAASLVFR